MSEELKARLRVAITDKDTAKELIAIIENLEADLEALTARVVALEEA